MPEMSGIEVQEKVVHSGSKMPPVEEANEDSVGELEEATVVSMQ
jgi:hypothetical protein